MSCSFRKIVQSLFLVLIGAGAGAYSVTDWPTLSGFSTGELHEVQVINTEIVKQIGRNAAMLYDNSDLVMRYSHYAVGHPKRIMFCPECFGTPIANTSSKIIAEIDQSPDGVTSDDLVRDAEEIQRGIASIGSTIYGQKRALLFSLLKLRHKNRLNGSPARKPISVVQGR